jgi:uncharacterized tellurite resistance protein B-like protein
VYLHELTADQRRALIVLARQVIDADRRLAIQEVERLDRLYVEAGLTPEGTASPRAAGDLNLLFPSERARTVVLLELLLVAHADGVLDEREVAAIRAIAAQMGLDAGTWSGALDWAERYVALVQEGADLGR